MKTDLARILSVSGQHGLFNYIAQARNGAIVEALSDKRRTCFDMKSRITTLADISIYTSEGEMKLQEVFQKLHEADSDRFYVSHMKKVVDWYNELKNFASLDFEEGNEGEAASEEAKEEDKVNE